MNNMKKLRIALAVVFSLCFSLFLVACGGGKEVTEIELSGGTRTFTEGEAFSTGDLQVTVYYRGSDKAVVLESGKYEVDDSAYNPDKAGTYTIVITPEQTPAEGAQPVTATYDVTVEHSWTASTEEAGTEVCGCGAKRTNLTGLNDKMVMIEWNNPATIEISENSPAEAPSNGENHVTYGVLVAGQTMTLTLQIDAADASQNWFAPLMGFRNGADGVLPREDLWVIVDAGKSGYTTPGMTAGTAATGSATTESPLWQVYYRGEAINAGDMQPSGDQKATVVVQYDYTSDSIMYIRHTLTPAGGGATKELIYSVLVPNASYEICAYGEKCSYTVTAVETVMNTYMTGFEGKITANQIQAEGKMFDTSGIESTATMSDGNKVEDLFNAYAMLDGSVVNLAVTPLAAGMTDFYIEFAGAQYYLTSDGTADGQDSVTVLPTEFTQVTASAVVKGEVFDAPQVAADYAVDAAGDAVEIVVTGTANMLTAAQKEALGTDKSAFVAFKLSALSEGVTAVSVDNGGYAVLVDGIIEVVLPVGADYTVTITAGETTQAAKVNMSAVTAPTAGAYVSASDFTLDAGGTYTVVYTGITGDVDALSLVTGGKRDTIADIKAEITAEGQYTALRNQMYINSVEETEEGLVVVYEVAAPQIVNLSATNVSRAVEIRNADNESLASLTLYYNMSFSDAPSGAYAKISDDTVVFISGDLMYVIKGVTAESVAGKLEYTDLFIDATLNIENDLGQPYDVSISSSADGTKADVNNTITLSSGATAKVVTLGNVGDDTDYDYGALLVYQFSVTALGLRTEDTAEVFRFTANEDNTNGQETYTIFTVTGNEITSEVVTPAGERTETQGFSCVSDGIEVYTTEDGFKYGAIITPATGVHEFGEFVEDVATCSVCGATKTKIAIDESSYYEVIMLAPTGGEPVVNTDTDGADWWVGTMGQETLVGNFQIRYTWTNTRDAAYLSDGALMLEYAGSDESIVEGLHKRFLENATDASNTTQITAVTNHLWGEDSVITAKVYKNGEETTYPANAFDQGKTTWEGDYEVIATRIGTTLTIEEKVVLASGDTWTGVLTVTNFTTETLLAQIGGNAFWLDNIRVTVATVNTVVDKAGDAAGTVVAPIAGLEGSGLSISATISGHTGDWGTHIIDSKLGMHVTLPNLDPWSNTTGTFPTSVNVYPTTDDLVGKDPDGTTVIYDCFFKADPLYMTVSISLTEGVKYYRNGELMIWYKADRVISGTTTIADFVEVLFEDIAENGFTFMVGAAAGSTTTDLHIGGALTDVQAQAQYEAQLPQE